jgi:hypothetical protein
MPLRGGGVSRGAAVLTTVSMVGSIAGIVLFIEAISDGASLVLRLGLTERIAFDALTI